MAVWWETTKEGGFKLYVPQSNDKTQPKKAHVVSCSRQNPHFTQQS